MPLLAGGRTLAPRNRAEARKGVTRLGTLIAATGDPEERARLSRLRADAELRYQLLVERAGGDRHLRVTSPPTGEACASLE